MTVLNANCKADNPHSPVLKVLDVIVRIRATLQLNNTLSLEVVIVVIRYRQIVVS